MSSILGVDVGGTFTDFLLWQDGSLSVYKRPSTPADPAEGVLLGLVETSARPESVVHGSTIATNALIERKGARTALITSRGFRDVLLIGRQSRPELYDLSPRRQPPLVPDELRLEASERIDHTGRALVPLEAAEVERLLDRLEELQVESLAVSFLFAFLNPEHERIVARAGRKRRLFVSASHEILPEHREYERTATTVVNAYVSPVMGPYLIRLEEGLAKRGVGRLSVMRSDGGSMSPAAASRLAVRTILSGPVAGVVAAFWLAKEAGFDHVITLDMGGTSADVSLCPGFILERDEASVGEVPLRGSTVDVVSVGAGGGCLARLDEGGALRVGPESAGADAGAACYGNALEPTVTDAQVVLGRILPEHFLGGRLEIDPQRSYRAIEKLAPAFASDCQQAAGAITRVVNANMERALRVVSVERGYDPRQFALLAFGGAGPLHACELAETLRIPNVLIPLYPGVLSALGMVVAEPTRDLSASAMVMVPAEECEEWSEATAVLSRRFDEIYRRGLSELRDEGFATDSLRKQRFLEMRYLGQSYELSVPVDDLFPASFLPRFHSSYHKRYSHSDPSRPVEVVNVRLKLVMPGQRPSMPPLPDSSAEAGEALIGRRQVWFDGPRQAPVYERSRLPVGSHLRGPAVIAQMDTTTAVSPGWDGVVDAWGNLVLRRSDAKAS